MTESNFDKPVKEQIPPDLRLWPWPEQYHFVKYRAVVSKGLKRWIKAEAEARGKSEGELLDDMKDSYIQEWGAEHVRAVELKIVGAKVRSRWSRTT